MRAWAVWIHVSLNVLNMKISAFLYACVYDEYVYSVSKGEGDNKSQPVFTVHGFVPRIKTAEPDW